MAAHTGSVTDFEYFAGAWRTRQHRLKARGVGSTDWEDFPGVLCMSPYLGGMTTVDELYFPTKGWAGLTIRAFNLATKQWSIYWINSTTGKLEPPVVGGFDGDRGLFYGEDQDSGRPVVARYTWRKIDHDHARWEQAFLYDGRTWETNWTADFERADPATTCEAGRPKRLDSGLVPRSTGTAAALEPQLAEAPLATREDELNAAFMPDGKAVYFTRRLGDRFGVIMVSHLRDGQWSVPTVAPFSGQYPDFDPFVAPDGKRMFWISLRPVGGGAVKADYDIWMAERSGDGWGPAVHLDGPVNSPASEYFPAVARNGTLYFSSSRPGGSGRGDIYFSRLADGAYRTVESVGEAINTPAFEGDALIAPDESYLVFTGFGRPDSDDGDLFVSVNRAGTWSAARKLENGINSAAKDYAPGLSPDGRWFYFTSYRSMFDAPLGRPLTSSDVRQVADGPMNGKGNVYRVPIEAVLRPE